MSEVPNEDILYTITRYSNITMRMMRSKDNVYK